MATLLLLNDIVFAEVEVVYSTQAPSQLKVVDAPPTEQDHVTNDKPEEEGNGVEVDEDFDIDAI